MSAEVFLDDKEVKDFLKNLDAKLKSIKGGKKQYLTLLTTIVYRDINEHFAKEESEEGAWQHWSEAYKRDMERRGKGGNKILQDSGRLRNNFQMVNVRSESKGISWFNNAVTKSGFPYAWAHNEGDGKLPKRDFMWASEKSQDQMALQTLQYILEMGV